MGLHSPDFFVVRKKLDRKQINLLRMDPLNCVLSEKLLDLLYEEIKLSFELGALAISLRICHELSWVMGEDISLLWSATFRDLMTLSLRFPVLRFPVLFLLFSVSLGSVLVQDRH